MESGDLFVLIIKQVMHFIGSLADLRLQIGVKGILSSLQACDMRNCVPYCIVAEEIRLGIVCGGLFDLQEELIKLGLRWQGIVDLDWAIGDLSLRNVHPYFNGIESGAELLACGDLSS